jgi:hypothetical protein
MQVGRDRESVSFPYGSAGFAVTAVDQTGGSLSGQLMVNGTTQSLPAAFITNGAGSTDDISRLGVLLGALDKRDGATVLLQSFGKPRPTGTGWNAIADGIAGLGGDASSLRQLNGSGDYAFVGCPTASDADCVKQPTFNEMNRKTSTPGEVGARLEGLLSRDSDSTFTASEQATPATIDETFRELAERASTAWPYDDGGQGTAALNYVAANVKLGKQTCPADIGPVRNTYCLATAGGTTSWSDRAAELRALAAPPTDTVSSGVWDAVKAQLLREWAALDNVHNMFSDVNQVYDWQTSSNTDAQAIANTIYSALPARPANPSFVGGLLDLLQSGLQLAGDVTPLLASHQPVAGHAQPLGAGDDFDPSDTVQAMLGISSASLGLAGDNDSDSPGASLTDLRTNASSYAGALDAQMKLVKQNLPGVENTIVTDPTRLLLASANTTQAWDFTNKDTVQATKVMEAGATRALWTQLLPTAVQMWQFPLIRSPYTLQGMICDSGAFEPRYAYQGQPDGAVFTEADSLGSNGAIATGKTETLTAIGNNDILHYQNRNVSQSLLDALYAPVKPGTANGGFTQGELPGAIPFDVHDEGKKPAANLPEPARDCSLIAAGQKTLPFPWGN